MTMRIPATLKRSPHGLMGLAILLAATGMAGCGSGTSSASSNVRTGVYRPAVYRPMPPERPPPALSPPAASPSPAGSAPAAGSKAWVPQFKSRRWQGIVIHHTAVPATGNAATIDRAHKGRGFDGLGYHFVIGNGSKSGDGEIEVGFRWPIQREGAHCKVPGAGNWWNEHTIGIVLIGDFTHRPPSAAQQRSLVQLTGWLMREYNIPFERVYLHRELKGTECPGKAFPARAVRQQLRASATR